MTKQQSFGDETFFRNIDAKMAESVFLRRNPVLHAIKKQGGTLPIERLEWVTAQYCALPASIVWLLRGAEHHVEAYGRKLDRLEDYARMLGERGSGSKLPSNVHNELLRNIEEERGSRTGGVAHYEILVSGLRDELQLDVKKIERCPATDEFIRQLSTLQVDKLMEEQKFFRGNLLNVLGAVYALEASATPELIVVGQLLDALAEAKGLPKITNSDSKLGIFLDRHINDFEPGHHNGLKHALKKDFSIDSPNGFNRSFRAVLKLMDAWWTALALEINNSPAQGNP